MKTKLFITRTPFRFTRFSRKSYALFATLGREVQIGVLSVLSLATVEASATSTEQALSRDSLQHDEVKLGEVVVTGSRAPLTQLETAKIVAVVTRAEIDRAAAATVNDILKLVTGVDVRQRGAFGVQTDISIRGGNFDQITILLNGVNISSPQTGHHSADFPVSPDDIERVEVLEGAYSHSLCGVVNIVTREASSSPNLYAHLSGGSCGYANANAGASASSGRFRASLSGGYTCSDGPTPNSAFSKSRLYFNGGYSAKNLAVNAQIGYSYKPYEANTFYGTASTDQWESNERWIASLSADVAIGPVHLKPSVYHNRFYDHYQWHRFNPAGENFHNVASEGAALSAWGESRIGKTSVGVELRHEKILSTALGRKLPEEEWADLRGHDASQSEKKYSCRDSREVLTIFAEHSVILKDWTFTGATNIVRRPLAGWGVYPSIDVAWRLAKGWRMKGAWNTALRLPTFTDLYYSGANIEGNSNLKPEKTSDFQLSLSHSRRGIFAEALLFTSHKRDMIDWVTILGADDGVFHSTNFRMNNFGAEARLRLLPQEWWGCRCPLRSLGLQYAYLTQHSRYELPVLKSKYAMEYLRHRLIASADVRLYRELGLSLSWRFNDRIGPDNPSYALLDARLSWTKPHYTLYLDATNVLNHHYADYSTIPQPGTILIAGLKVRI